MQTATQQVKKDTQPAPEHRVLKRGSCSNLSESAQLGYEFSSLPDSSIWVRVNSNSGSGYWSKEWVSMESIGKALGESTNITAFSLLAILKGKSCNSGGFILAALKAEGLVLASADKAVRNYQLGDPGKFMAEMKLLMESSVNIDAEAKPKKAKKSA